MDLKEIKRLQQREYQKSLRALRKVIRSGEPVLVTIKHDGGILAGAGAVYDINSESSDARTRLFKYARQIRHHGFNVFGYNINPIHKK